MAISVEIYIRCEVLVDFLEIVRLLIIKIVLKIFLYAMLIFDVLIVLLFFLYYISLTIIK